MRNFGIAFGLLLAISAGGCSTVMEATRPDPVDLDRFKPGQSRIDVIGEVGAPLSIVKVQNNKCDVYKLYTRGPGAWGKAGIALGEAAADVFTLGLAEVVTTPGEAATRNSLHTVLFCYDADEKLALVRESDTHVDNESAPASTSMIEDQPAAPASSTMQRFDQFQDRSSQSDGAHQ